MAQTRHSQEDAWSLAEKLTAFADTLTPGELAAWEELERHFSTLVPTEDEDVRAYMIAPDSVTAMAQARGQELRDEAARERTGRTVTARQALWRRLITSRGAPRQ